MANVSSLAIQTHYGSVSADSEDAFFLLDVDEKRKKSDLKAVEQ